jgi:hypothetical protein
MAATAAGVGLVWVRARRGCTARLSSVCKALAQLPPCVPSQPVTVDLTLPSFSNSISLCTGTSPASLQEPPKMKNMQLVADAAKRGAARRKSQKA